VNIQKKIDKINKKYTKGITKTTVLITAKDVMVTELEKLSDSIEDYVCKKASETVDVTIAKFKTASIDIKLEAVAEIEKIKERGIKERSVIRSIRDFIVACENYLTLRITINKDKELMEIKNLEDIIESL